MTPSIICCYINQWDFSIEKFDYAMEPGGWFPTSWEKSINTRFNLLSHLPNTGQEVKLEIGSPTKHQWIDTTSCFLNIKALCSSVEPRCFCKFKHRIIYTHIHTQEFSAYNMRELCFS